MQPGQTVAPPRYPRTNGIRDGSLLAFMPAARSASSMPAARE
jgi:hypothetical protein